MPCSADKVTKKESFLFKLILHFSCALPDDSLPLSSPQVWLAGGTADPHKVV